MDFYKDILLNIFVIFSPLVFYPYINKLEKHALLYRILLYILFASSLIATMSFPLNVDGFNYDFRSISFTVGALYGGTEVAIALYLTIVSFRHFLDSPHTLIYAIALFPSLLMLLFVINRFRTLGVHQKALTAVVSCFLIKLVTFALYLSMTGSIGALVRNPASTFKTYLVQAVFVSIYIYLLEFVRSHFKMQDELIKYEKTKIVSDIAASVAHEVRNPLTSVRGFLQLLARDDLSPDKRKNYQKICLEELDRAQQIISDYLTLAKPSVDIKEPIHIKDEIIYISNVLNSYAAIHNVNIDFLKLENELTILGDKSKFRQAIINLGKNAIEAMPDGGLLTFNAFRREGNIVLIISDTGIGMTKDQLNNLGTPYYSTKNRGTGLGTMVTFSLIKQMHGQIKAKSEPGKGTFFTITF